MIYIIIVSYKHSKLLPQQIDDTHNNWSRINKLQSQINIQVANSPMSDSSVHILQSNILYIWYIYVN